jgi:hypothetical protein
MATKRWVDPVWNANCAREWTWRIRALVPALRRLGHEVDLKRRQNMKILMVLTSHDQLGATGRQTGFWLEELAAPYFVFRDAGVDLTLASPKGGQPPIDPKSDLPDNQTPAMARFKQDTVAQKALKNVLAVGPMLTAPTAIHEIGLAGSTPVRIQQPAP